MALENYTIKDDFPIISHSINLLNEEGITNAFFITKDGYVVAHSDRKKIRPEGFEHSEEYNKPFFLKGRDLKDRSFDYQLYQDEKFYDIYAPVGSKNKYFGDVHIIFSREVIFKSIKEARDKILFITLFTLLLGIAGAFYLSISIVKPIKKLAQGAHVIGTGNLKHKIDIKSKDEIGFLASEFNEMTGKLSEAQKAMMEKQKLENEMKIAAEIQTMLLPEKLPEYTDLELFAFYQPAKQVGGDYYDFIKLSDDKLGILVADVSGKSVSGSLGMTIFRTIFHTIIHPDLNAYDTLCMVNKLIQPDIPTGMFITAFYGILDLKKKKLDYANAGHDPLIVYNNETKAFNEYKADAPSVGIMEESIFNAALQKNDLLIKKNDILIQYSDGIPEGMDKERNQFGEERFHNSIKKHGALHVEKFVNSIKEDLFAFTKGAKQSDDITLIGVKLVS